MKTIKQLVITGTYGSRHTRFESIEPYINKKVTRAWLSYAKRFLDEGSKVYIETYKLCDKKRVE